VCVRAPQESQGREAGELQVVDVLAPAGDELRVLDPSERLTDVRAQRRFTDAVWTAASPSLGMSMPHSACHSVRFMTGPPS
jgi:hypothetical protein